MAAQQQKDETVPARQADELAQQLQDTARMQLMLAQQRLSTSAAQRVELTPEALHRMADDGTLVPWFMQFGLQPPAEAAPGRLEAPGERAAARPEQFVL